jgi:hypothetical protein
MDTSSDYDKLDITVTAKQKTLHIDAPRASPSGLESLLNHLGEQIIEQI